jgi:hypothetical protein
MVAKKSHCPVCGRGRLHLRKVNEEMFGIDLGTFAAEVCDNCWESFLTSERMDVLEDRAKELGLWGLASKVKVARSGSSFVVCILTPLARYLRRNSGQEGFVATD